MAILMDQVSARSARWEDYQLSFQEFSRTAAMVQQLTAQRAAGPDEFARAVAALENARVAYNHARDALAAELLERGIGKAA